MSVDKQESLIETLTTFQDFSRDSQPLKKRDLIAIYDALIYLVQNTPERKEFEPSQDHRAHTDEGESITQKDVNPPPMARIRRIDDEGPFSPF